MQELESRTAQSAAMRIVSLLPSSTEILFGIGAGPQVVGVTHECDFPAACLGLPHLTSSALPATASPGDIDRHVRASLHAGSSLYHLDAELLERLQPDLIVTQELCEVCAVSYAIVDRAARRLAPDSRIVSLEPSSLEDVFANIRYLGSLTGCGPQADAMVASLRERVDALRSRSNDVRVRPRALILEWTDPPMSGGHWTPGLVALAGAEPVLGNPGANSVTLAWESIAAADPDAIVVAPCGFNLAATRRAVAVLESNPIWTTLRAYREGRVHVMDGNAYLNRPGPRLVDTAEIMFSMLHPARASETSAEVSGPDRSGAGRR